MRGALAEVFVSLYDHPKDFGFGGTSDHCNDYPLLGASPTAGFCSDRPLVYRVKLPLLIRGSAAHFSIASAAC